jgi:hypothetical protein
MTVLIDPRPAGDGRASPALWRAEVEHSRAVVAGRRECRPFGPVNLRWILAHLLEEYARHCGHADLLRERIDGVTGD